jgi:hypothetical protein
MHRGERAELRVYRYALWIPLALPARSIFKTSEGLEGIYSALGLAVLLWATALYTPIACIVSMALQDKPLRVARTVIAIWPMMLVAPIAALSWQSPHWLSETAFCLAWSYGSVAIVFVAGLLARLFATPRGTRPCGSQGSDERPPIVVFRQPKNG